MSEGAQILDRGYRPYDGPRGGAPTAVRTVAVQGLRSVLGIGRRARSKVLPIVSVAIAFIPAIVFVGLAVLLPPGTEDFLPDYPDYYGFIFSALILFTAFVAPEILTGDRRTGMLPLYLSTPLTRTTYLLAKLGAIAVTLSIVTLGPVLLLLLSYTLEGIGPDGVLEWMKALGRILASGLFISGVYASISMAFSAITDRRALASAGVILSLVVSAAVTGALVEAAELTQRIYLFNVAFLPLEAVGRIYGQTDVDVRDLTTLEIFGANLAWIVIGLGITWWRYLRMEVTR